MELSKPPTEIEVADALAWLRAIPSAPADVIRRLAFQRDMLIAENERLLANNRKLNAELSQLTADNERYVNGVESAMEKECVRLQAIVDQLPKTADGVPVVPGMDVWDRCGHKYTLTGCQVLHGELSVVYDRGGFDAVGPWYSTREAAQAAERGE